MDNAILQTNAAALEREAAWFGQVLHARFAHYFGEPGLPFALDPAPDLGGDASDYAQLVRELALGPGERLVLMLALLPHLRPQALDLFFTQNKLQGQRFTEFGGWRGKTHEGFLPTCETAAFLLAGDDLARRFAVLALFDDAHPLMRERVLRLEYPASGEPQLGAMLIVTPECLQRVTTGIRHKPDYASNFPAKLITTRLTWDDLVLAPEARHDVESIEIWIRQSGQLLRDWSLERSVKPGYRCLFYGPPGTGKTLTATLIGAAAGVDVYRIDLSMLVSKYIGETEKNLANVFDQAQDRRWILFFDEADALFGTRTEGNTSNDRHANQEIAYLLQRVEDFPGVVILASNLKGNIDQAFARRFQGAIYFGMPDCTQRLRLWRGMFRDPARLGPDVDLRRLAEEHELSGGSMTNVARYAAICATRQDRAYVTQAELLQGIRKEMLKEGRSY
ncbi:ATP-binding protein [Pseudoduganella armeniaca]|uniref:AAA family ATPase n=1 Tax=Pseudoduganella armeniaca TaxID=2072590 RepID=A0A2R4CC97_9BURK|nr:ATP-binding protein [Pseudoduganella armeniaca]AVR97110.1 AAA family ATPase [Pseudoduganella armeniaca]